MNALNSLLLATTRIEAVRAAGGATERSRASPANAGTRQPHQVEYRSSLATPGIPLTNANAFRYETDRTHWIDDAEQTGGITAARSRRLGLRPF